MSKTAKSKSSKSTDNLVSDFINKSSSPEEPLSKKIKKTSPAKTTSNEDANDSFKFFKNFKPKRNNSKLTESTSSNLATKFLESSTKNVKTSSQKKQVKASTKNGTKRKPKQQPDIRNVLGKQEQLFNHIVTENCLEEGIDLDEMQLALAISESLKEQAKLQEHEPSTSAAASSKFENPFVSMGKVQTISSVLERFGFKTKKTYSEYEIDMITNGKLSKRSKFQKFPTVLTRTSNEKRNEMIKTRIDKILDQNPSQGSNASCGPSRHEYQVFSFQLQELQEDLGTVFMISSDDRRTDEILLNYYVTELFEPSFVKAGHLLKDWSKIPGRDPTPERTSNSNEVNVESEVLDEIIEKEPEMANVKDDPENNSCMDIFADVEDYESETSGIAGNSSKENSRVLGHQLDSLHEKLSQSIHIEVADKKPESDATIITDYHSKCLQNREAEKVDLTQLESSDEGDFTIPYDDSYHSLQEHIKKMKLAEQKAETALQVEISSVSNQPVSPIQIDLVSSEDEKILSSDELMPSPHQSTSKDGVLDTPNDKNDLLLSQSSLNDDELTEISDEEINYSIRQYHDYEESPEEETVDLTQGEEDPESPDAQFEVINNVEQSLLDVMSEEEEFDINQTISNLLETSVATHNLSMSVKERSTSPTGSDGLSESIRDIMRRYGAPMDEKKNPRSLRKINSESHLVTEDARKRRTVLFDIDEEDAVVHLTQNIDEEINCSIRKYHDHNESPGTSFQSPTKKTTTCDLTQEEAEPESSGAQFEVINNVEQTLLDVMSEQEEFDINGTVSNLLETSVFAHDLDTSVKDRSAKVMETDFLSESIRDIMRRYGVPMEEKKNTRSLRKINSESQLVTEDTKKRRTVLFDIDEENVVDLTQNFEDNEAKDSSSRPNFDDSVQQSLENIVSYSPIAPRRKTQHLKQTRAKRSLGVQLDNDYIVDTETFFPEPDYKNMTPVELKKALFKYGIRPLPVKKAVQLLEFIYDQLHPKIRVAAEEEIDVNDSRRDMNVTDILPNINVVQDDDFVFQLGLVDDEDFVLPNARKSKIPSCVVPLHISFYNMVRSNEKIQKFILEFRPIELDQIHKHFRKFGLSYQMNDIIAFLDKRCITFKTKEKSLSKTHERKKQKRAAKSQKSQSQKV